MSEYARRVRIRRAPVIVAIVVAVIVATGLGYLGFRAFQDRLAAARRLDTATARLAEADRVVVQVDEVVRARVTAGLASRARTASANVEPAEEMLNEVVTLVDQASPDLTDDERERGALLKDAAEARLAMLKEAPEILAYNAAAATALPLAEEGWKLTLDADELSDKAVASYNKLTRAAVTTSRRFNRAAAARLTAARDRFNTAEASFPGAPFEAYIEYLDSRLALNTISQQSDAAWLAGQLEKANQLIDSYNEQDKNAVEQAKRLPSSPETAIAEAFEGATAESSKRYYAARERAVQADRRLRSF